VVKFKPGRGGASAQGILQAENLQVMRSLPASGMLQVQVPPGQEAQAIARLSADPNVEFATYNHRVQAFGDPDDPYYGLQWALEQTSNHDIDAPQAWDVSTGAQDVIIAIVDSGIDLSHADLAPNLWVNTGEVPGNGNDDDGNGYVDDRYGYDFHNRDADPTDDFGHGTHVAGIAGATGNNGIGISGVNWRARLMALKALDANGNGLTSNVVEAIYYAVNNGARVVNMSLGHPMQGWPCEWTEIENAFNYAVGHNVLLVAASGNQYSDYVHCPAAYDQTIAVGATTRDDLRASYSNYGTRLDITAPGGDWSYGIYSTLPGWYGYMYGTSMATPHVAGLAALIWSFAPDLSDNQVRAIIESTADDLGAAGWDQFYGHGRISARRALESLLTLQASPAQASFLADADSGPTPPSHTVQLNTNSPADVTWNATISPGAGWLSVLPPGSGTVSASSAASFTLAASRPGSYGTYTAQVTITGTMPSGSSIGQAVIPVSMIYVTDTFELRFPAIFKNGTLKVP
jgi:subtilisin family serine protease